MLICNPVLKAMRDFSDWLAADELERELMKKVPRGCINCELLGLCRDRDNNWKCRHGCMVIEARKMYEQSRK